MLLTVLVFAPLALLTFPLPHPLRYRFISQWARLQTWLIGVLCGVRYRVEGREHLPKGPAIILAKHQSAWETIAFQKIFPIQTWVLKRELLLIPFFGWGLALMKPIAIDRGAGRKAVTQVIEQGQARLKEGIWIVVFPEGTRMAPGTTRRYGIGGAALAAESGYPVVPVAHNAGFFWPRRGFLKKPGTIHVVIGPVIHTRGKSAEEINRAAEEWIENKMVELEKRTSAS
ncbi:MAG: 1-acyl-sn-glycerol-3-phosphate acyltransferase [Gammaproteobacteria bacterium]|nr:MAG: 1-acyl-sn-glycerol-3-phosphate acyltransferase [Gammaproteobacteria bacterium]